MTNHKVTLKDVAVAAGVSITAVSLVLNNRPTRMSQYKRKLIAETAEQLNYIPNQAARSLTTNRSMLLALLLPDIENIFFASLAKALEDASREEGYSLIIANSDDSYQNEHQLLRQFSARGIDGLFLIPSQQSTQDSKKLQQDVDSLDFPVILTDRLVSEDWCDAVGSDDFAGGRLVAQTLIRNGHRRIACISGNSGHESVNDRRAGFIAGLEEAGLNLNEDLDLTGDYRLDGGYQAADRIIDAQATAVFCGNDLMALGFIRRLEERGLHCPQDCSVIGYDNVIERLGFNAQLTTIDQNITAVAQACHDCISARLSHTTDKPWLVEPTRHLVEPELITGSTVSPI